MAEVISMAEFEASVAHDDHARAVERLYEMLRISGYDPTKMTEADFAAITPEEMELMVVRQRIADHGAKSDTRARARARRLLVAVGYPEDIDLDHLPPEVFSDEMTERMLAIERADKL